MLLTRLVDFAISPLGLGLFCALLLWRTHGRRRWRWLWHAALLLSLVCVLLATTPGARLLVEIQERRVVAAGLCAPSDDAPVVLLAGGLRRAPLGVDDVPALSDASLRRTLDAATLAQADPSTQFVVSGGTWPGEHVAESTLMAALMQRLGVPAASIRTEIDSRTTWQNATRVRALDPPLPTHVRLATSAVHMPRSLLAFRAAGFTPCALPLDARSAPLRQLADLLPSGGAIALSTAVLHEWVGEIAYRLRFTPPPSAS